MSPNDPADEESAASWDDEAVWDDRADDPPRYDDGANRPERSDPRGGAQGRPPGDAGRPRSERDAPDRWVDALPEQRHRPRSEGARDGTGFDPALFDAGVASFTLGYPTAGGPGGAAITIVLGLFSVLLVPGVLVAGYLTRLAGAAARAEEPPGYGDPLELLKLGVVTGTTLVLVGGGLGGIVYVTAGESTLLASVLALAGTYLLPGLFATFGATEDLREAVVRTPEFAFTTRYLTHFVVAVVLLLVVAVGSLFLVVFVPFGLLLTPLLALYPATYWGYLYGEAIEDGDVRPLPPRDG